MPASEYMLSCRSLLNFSSICRITDELWNINSAIYLYSTTDRAEVTQNIGTSPSSDVGRYFKVTQSDKIITAARRYCLDLFQNGLSTQQRIATGLLQGVEYLVGRQFPNSYDLKAELKQLALESLKETTSGYSKEGHLKKIELEKQNFLEFIDQLDTSSPDNIEPLPYRRRLSESEAIGVRQNLKSKWNFDGWSSPSYYWEPLVVASPTPVYFFNTEVLSDKDFESIGKLLWKLTGDTIYEVTEDKIDYEIETSQIDKYTIEAAYTDKLNNWIIYLSHEGTTAFGGDELMKELDILLADKSELKDKW